VETALSIVATAQRDLSGCAAAQERSLEGALTDTILLSFKIKIQHLFYYKLSGIGLLCSSFMVAIIRTCTYLFQSNSSPQRRNNRINQQFFYKKWILLRLKKLREVDFLC